MRPTRRQDLVVRRARDALIFCKEEGMGKTGKEARGVRASKKTWTYGLSALCVVVAMLGCVPENNGGGGFGGFSSVSGTVQDQPFFMYSGVAERVGQGFFITLTDSSSFGCVSTPSGNYLKIVVNAAGEGSFNASGSVTFGSVEDNLEDSDAATSGSGTISSIDEVAKTISGNLSAQGSASDVSGNFSVDICD